MPTIDSQDDSSIRAFIRTPPSAPHSVQRARSVLRAPRRPTRAGTGGQSPIVVILIIMFIQRVITYYIYPNVI